MNDLFYNFGWVFIAISIRDLIFFNKDFEKTYAISEKCKESVNVAKKSLRERDGMDLEELGNVKSQLDGLMKDNLKNLDDRVKPNSFSNIITVVWFIWHIAGTVISNLWILFSLNIVITAVSAFFPLFIANLNKKQNKIISMCSMILKTIVIGLIVYLHFN